MVAYTILTRGTTIITILSKLTITFPASVSILKRVIEPAINNTK